MGHSPKLIKVERENTMLSKIVKMLALAFVAAAFGGSNCRSCLRTGDFGSCLSSCAGYSPMFMESMNAPEKRGGLRAMCLKNPRALPCMRALGVNQNSNLMW